jgi:hypothetical protein
MLHTASAQMRAFVFRMRRGVVVLQRSWWANRPLAQLLPKHHMKSTDIAWAKCAMGHVCFVGGSCGPCALLVHVDRVLCWWIMCTVSLVGGSRALLVDHVLCWWIRVKESGQDARATGG